MCRQFSFKLLFVFIGTCCCKDDLRPALRLVGGSGPGEGRVEVFIAGEWGTICDDLWDSNDAKVVCRQLGYSGAEMARRLAYFGQGRGRIWLDDVQCTGDEESLADCPQNELGEHNCQHYEDAGVECKMHEQETVPEETRMIEDVRLVGGSSANVGRVEVFVDGQWGTVCDDHWDVNDATVVCRQLGYPSADSAEGFAFFGEGSDPIWLDNVGCSGEEENLNECPKNDFEEHNCNHDEDAGVRCTRRETSATTESTENDAYVIYSESDSIQTIPLEENHKNSIRSLTNVVRAVGIAPVYSKTGLFFSDIASRSILYSSLGTEDTSIVTIREGIGSVEGIAYNHITKEIFWTSYTYSSISRMRVFPQSPTGEEVVVRMSKSDHPRGIALDVCNSSMFWTNWNELQPSIMKASMAGQDIRAIITTNIRMPNGIAIDAYASKLYWCDARLDSIERSNLDGTNRVVIVDSDAAHQFALAVHEDNLYWTDWLSHMVIRVNKFTGGNMTVLRSDLVQQPMGIAILAEPHNCSSLPCATHNGGCEDICETDEYGTIKCSCKEGKASVNYNQRCLAYCQPDEFQCGYDNCINQDRRCNRIIDCDDAVDEIGCENDAYVIYSEADSIKTIPLGENKKDYIRSLVNVDRVIGIAPVYSKTGLFFSDFHRGSILYSSLKTDNTSTVTIREGIGTVEGIAYNHITKEIFWTSYTNSSISRMRVFPQSPTGEEVVVRMSERDHLRGIALDVCNSSMFWTNWNDLHPSIMKASMAGKDLRAIITTNIRMPNGIAIDAYASKLYWCDARLDKIERSNLDGTNRVVIIDSGPAHPFALTVHEDSLYWTDWGNRMVIRVNKYTGGNMTILQFDLHQSPMGIAILVEPHDCSSLPCATYNGGCEEICETDEYGTINCSCGEGKTLADDNQRCFAYYDDIRLLGGPSENEGRIEALVKGEWGTVCDDLWDLHDATVACRELGYLGADRHRISSYYGGGSGPIWLDNVDCTGDEKSLNDCSKNRIGVTDCNHFKDAGVVCTLTRASTTEPPANVDSRSSTLGTPVIQDIRLVNGYSHFSGRVEVYVNGEWGTICHYSWEREDADVACRWLGYTGADVAKGNAFFGEGTGPIWLDNVLCRGDEETLNECRMRPIGEHNCDHDEDAGVECTIVPRPFGPRPGYDYRDDLRCRGGYSAPNFEQARCNRNGPYPCCSPELWCGNTPEHCECEGCVDYRDASVRDIRLSGPYPHAGKVEVFVFGEWGSVCNDYWDMADATVACRMLGYPGADEIKMGDYYGEGLDPVVMDDVHCTGDEESLSDCPRNEPGYQDCDHRYEAASVVCTLLPSTMLPPPTTENI